MRFKKTTSKNGQPLYYARDDGALYVIGQDEHSFGDWVVVVDDEWMRPSDAWHTGTLVDEAALSTGFIDPVENEPLGFDSLADAKAWVRSWVDAWRL